MVTKVKDAYNRGRGVALGITTKAVLQESVAGIADTTSPNVTTPFVSVSLACSKVDCVY